MNCICLDCKHKCSEYYANGTSDNAYYEWSLKEEKCEKEDQNAISHVRRNRQT